MEELLMGAKTQDVKLEPKHLASIKKLKQQPKAQDQIEIFGVSPKNLTSIKKPDDGVIQRDVGKIRKGHTHWDPGLLRSCRVVKPRWAEYNII
ncbi:hypothetical protein WN943_018333 [Citrus x changshan-huyou]